MNRRASALILLALVAAGIGTLVWGGGNSHKESHEAPTPAKSTQRSTASSSEDKDQEPPKHQADPATKKLADSLVDFSNSWHQQNPDADREAWTEAAIEKLLELDLPSLLALASMPMKVRWTPEMGDATEIPPFFAYFTGPHNDALLAALGAKSFAAASAYFLSEQAQGGGTFTWSDDPDCTFAIIGLRKGLMRVDPAAAWADYLQLGKAGSPMFGDDPQELMTIHAKQDPAAAWQFILGVSQQGRLEKGMLQGYLYTVPERDWEPLARELAERIRQAPGEKKNDRDFYRLLAAGWAERKPQEALAWYFEATQELPPSKIDSDDPTAAETREILTAIPRLSAAVERMARDGHTDLAELVISNDFTAANRYSIDLKLLDGIALLPTPETRAALLEQASAVMAGNVGEYKMGWTHEDLDQALAALKAATEQSKLPPELQLRAEASIQALEARRPFARKK